MRVFENFLIRLLVSTICGVPLIVLGLTGCSGTPGAVGQRREAPLTTVTVVTARKRDVPYIRTPNATTHALNEVTIRARVKGFLKEKHFTEGSNVKAGELMLVIDEEPFKVEVAKAKATLEGARAELRKAQESKAKEVAKAQVALDETQLQLDRVEERRERILFARKASSQEDYDRAKAKAEKSVAQVQAASAALQQATADYDINILAAQAKIDKAAADLRDVEIELSYCRMYAPISGRAGELQVKQGNLVGPATGFSDTTSLVTIQQLDPMGIDIRPASRYLPTITQLVKNGLEVGLRVQGDRIHQYRGKVLFVDNAIDPTTSTVLLKAAVPNPDETILPGEYVKVDVNIGDYVGAIAIPEEAVMEAQEGPRVLVVNAQNQVEVAPVQTIDQYQGLVILKSGLEDGQKVIVKGLQRARPGQTVKVVETEIDSYIQPNQQGTGEDPLFNPMLRIRGSNSDQDPPVPDQPVEKPGDDRKNSTGASEPAPPAATPESAP